MRLVSFTRMPWALVLLLGACAPPTDTWTKVTAAAPLLGDAKPDAPLAAVLHQGDLVRVVKSAAPSFAWSGVVDGKPLSLDGELVEVRRTGEGSGLMWRKQLGPEVPVFSADYVCRRLRAGAECPARLRRIALDDQGTTFAYLPCATDGCPMALLRGRRMAQARVDFLTDARAAVVDGQPIVLVRAEVKRRPDHTQEYTHVFRQNESLERVYSILVNETDTRTPRNHFIDGTLRIEADQLEYRGREREVSSIHDNAVLSDHPIVQNYRLAPRR